jgi:hypothetical protein
MMKHSAPPFVFFSERNPSIYENHSNVLLPMWRACPNDLSQSANRNVYDNK